ncbi:NnrS family protein [Azospirillum picis]|uniref:Uncharacterized protein involved in response to NO n=1 Tax=Azospirillum picis TaxID=488438 RepID=A0ABU0MN38_9PROT|nr:NnrS family protein [Azospirillum picis]MBP2301161.1 uncharacterized protein involved in response to NO [Azospirillum picis]MDQ0534877.1 uncharacterized protein involved in response to NO [Azospirillum picis]
MPHSSTVSTAHRLFYPAAAIHGALAVPLWLAAAGGLLPLGWSPAVHAHEMVGGYALAVVGGFLMTRLTRAMLAAAFLAWLAGRLVPLAGPPLALALPVAAAYPLLLFRVAGLPFLRAGRSGHNAVFGPLVGAFTLAEILFRLRLSGILAGGPAGGALPVELALVGLLLLAMGGRVIPAATAGALRSRTLVLEHRVQPRLEMMSIAGALLYLLSSVCGVLPSLGAAGALFAGAGGLLRLARWRTLRLWRAPDILALHLGYLFVGSGWILAGAAELLGLPPAAAPHLLGIGGLGILATAMMVRTTLQREAEPPWLPAGAVAAVVLLAMAAMLRVAAAWWPDWPLLVASGTSWTVAQLLVAVVLLTRPRRRVR